MNLKQLLRGLPREWASLNAPLKIAYGPLDDLGLELYIKREDLLHPALSGNKIYKLHGHLMEAARQGASAIVSFGGYYSNHLHALAAVGEALGIQTIGVVRGHRPTQLSPTLQDCVNWGMRLEFVSRKEYAHAAAAGDMSGLSSEFAQAYVVPEGGAGRCGAVGCGPIISALRRCLDLEQSTLCIACGTGTTLAGLLAESRDGEHILGFASLKLGRRNQEYRTTIKKMLGRQTGIADWDLVEEFHCGGFGRVSKDLLKFIREFESITGIPLDPVYTGKMLYGIVQLAGRGYWPRGHRVVAIHTGGLQGRRGYPEISDRQEGL